MPLPASRKRIRRILDFNRLRQGLEGSNVESWVELARVDDVEDAISWIEGTGWVVDVSFITGELAEEAAVPCRVASHLGGNDQGVFTPIRRGCVVVVIIGSGNLNVAPVIIGYLHNPTDCQVPTEVNELPIDEDAALANVLVKSIANYEAEYGDEVRIQAKETFSVVSPRVNLSPQQVRDNSTEPFVLGDEFGDALGDFLDAIGTFTNTIANAANVVAFAMQSLVAPNPLSAVATPLNVYTVAVVNAMGALGGCTLVAPLATGVSSRPFAASAAGRLKATIAPRSQGGWKSERIYGE